MKTIWKFELNPHSLPTEIPKGAKLLTAQSQPNPQQAPENNICVWAEVDTEAPTEEVRFEIFGTGHMMPESTHPREYVGTVQLYGGDLVFHIYCQRNT